MAEVYLVEGAARWLGPVSIMHAEKGILIAMSIPVNMRALQQTSLDGPQDMRLITDAPMPVPGRGEVLIRVVAAGINFADISKAYGTFLGGWAFGACARNVSWPASWVLAGHDFAPGRPGRVA